METCIQTTPTEQMVLDMRFVYSRYTSGGPFTSEEYDTIQGRLSRVYQYLLSHTSEIKGFNGLRYQIERGYDTAIALLKFNKFTGDFDENRSRLFSFLRIMSCYKGLLESGGLTLSD